MNSGTSFDKSIAQAALLVVDVQIGIDDLFDAPRNNPQAEQNIAGLIEVWRNRGMEVVHVKHNSTSPESPLRPELPGNQFKPEALPQPAEKLFEKNVNSAFIGTGLQEYLVSKEIQNLVIVGLTTDHCISTTTRMAGNLGFTVFLVSDATATFGRTDEKGCAYTAEQIHEVNLLSLDSEFCTVVSTEQVLEGFGEQV